MKNISTISINDVTREGDTGIIKNFVVSDSFVQNRQYRHPDVVFGHPIIIEGIGFVICTSGNARIRLNLHEYEINDKSLVTIGPGVVLEPLQSSDELRMEFLFFSFDFVSDMTILGKPAIRQRLKLRDAIEAHPCITLTAEQKADFLEFHRLTVKYYKREEHPFREELAKTLLMALIMDMYSYYSTIKPEPAPAADRKQEIFERFMKLVYNNILTEKTVSFYAEQLCLTPKYMSHVIKEVSGKKAIAWLNEGVMMAAKAMLRSTDDTVLQISEKLNFPNPSLFGRFFKKHSGMTPMQYRAS